MPPTWSKYDMQSHGKTFRPRVCLFNKCSYVPPAIPILQLVPIVFPKYFPYFTLGSFPDHSHIFPRSFPVLSTTPHSFLSMFFQTYSHGFPNCPKASLVAVPLDVLDCQRWRCWRRFCLRVLCPRLGRKLYLPCHHCRISQFQPSECCTQHVHTVHILFIHYFVPYPFVLWIKPAWRIAWVSLRPPQRRTPSSDRKFNFGCASKIQGDNGSSRH